MRGRVKDPGAKEFFVRTRFAGRYAQVARYTRALPNDSAPVRRAKQAQTQAAQKFINIKNATEKLQLLLCANFDRKDACFCTFTFRDDQQPANQKHARQIFSAYLKSLKPEFVRHGLEFKYIYTVEGETSACAPSAAPIEVQSWEVAPWRDAERWATMDDTTAQEGQEEPKRMHVHCFLLVPKERYEAVRALWCYGQVHINRMKVNELTTFQRLANYVTKEKRTGSKGNGSRSYIPSLHLEQPTMEGHWCSEYEGITAPHGAEIIKSGAERDAVYGASMEFLFYRMPRAQQLPQPYKSKGKLAKQADRSRTK